MGRRRFFPRRQQDNIKYNDFIRVPEVRVIDENGENLGVMSTNDAKNLAKERGFDLVEISPNAVPPVCKIILIGSFRYQQMKEEKRKKKNAKKIETKGVRISIRTGENDLKFKGKQAEKFMDEGHRVKIDLMLRGREKANKAFAVDKMNAFMKNYISFEIITEQPLKFEGRGFTTIIKKKI